MANHSPPSSGRGRGWGFVSLSPFHEKAGGEALFLCKQSIDNLTLRTNKGENGG